MGNSLVVQFLKFNTGENGMIRKKGKKYPAWATKGKQFIICVLSIRKKKLPLIF